MGRHIRGNVTVVYVVVINARFGQSNFRIQNPSDAPAEIVGYVNDEHCLKL